MTNQEAVPAVALVLRTCDNNMQGYGGFQWPTNGEVSAPDWKSKPVCGNGLHGLLWANGSSKYLSRESDAKWLVCEVDPTTCVDLDDKVKFQTCNVIAVYSNMAEALTRIMFDPGYPHPNAKEIASGTSSTAASRGTYSKSASIGDFSKAVSIGTFGKVASIGDYGTAASSGNSSSASSSGDYSKASSSGDSSTASSSGASSKASSSGLSSSASSSGTSSKASSSGLSSIASSSGISSRAASIGESSTAASSGIGSTAASSGDFSSASSSGDSSSAASSGDSGIAAACGCETWVKAGPLGCIFATEWVAAEKRYRGAVGYIGENGVKADTWYRCVGGKLVEAK